MARKTCSCGGEKWVDDQMWAPDDPWTWDGVRTQRNGRIPCALCNLGGWDEPDGAQPETKGAS